MTDAHAHPQHPHHGRVRSYSWMDPEPDLAAMRRMSGLDYLNQNMDQVERAFRAPIGRTLDFRPVKFEHGVAVFEGFPAEFHYNPIGTVHGGFAATLLDSALGCAVHTTLKPGMAYTTVELKVNYVRALTAKTGPVTCEGRVVHVGGRIGTAEARLVDRAGKLYAHGTTTCLIFPME
ncbi:MAG: PaaI family thioesterase [Alphaproteobacteria bacterium]|nr:PaaI family thioesterase [Alphaproteobacteria bacterium]